MKIDSKDSKALETVVAVCRDALGPRLLAVVLYGEPASSAYQPGRTPLNLALVVDDVSFEVLAALQPHTAVWRRRRIGTPLVLDPAYIRTSRDTFPLEFLELHDHHLVIWGTDDPFAELEINHAHLRLEVEEQMKGKLLHLREAYLEFGPGRDLSDILVDSVLSFEIVLRGMVHLVEEEAPSDPDELIDLVEEALDLPLPIFQRLRRVRAGGEKLGKGEVEAVFRGFTAELTTLAAMADQT